MAKGQPIPVGLGTHSCAPQHSAQRHSWATQPWWSPSQRPHGHQGSSPRAQTTPASFGNWPLCSPPWGTFSHQLGLPSWYLLFLPSMCSQAELRQCRQGTVPWRTPTGLGEHTCTGNRRSQIIWPVRAKMKLLISFMTDLKKNPQNPQSNVGGQRVKACREEGPDSAVSIIPAGALLCTRYLFKAIAVVK